jgi:predicted ATPase
MITKITVDGFKSLAGFEIELGQVNVLIGANGSGKTNILEAIGVLSAAASGRVDDESLSRRGARLGLATAYMTSLRQIGTAESIRICAQWHQAGQLQATYSVALSEPPDARKRSWAYETEVLQFPAGHAIDRRHAANGQLEPTGGYVALRKVDMQHLLAGEFIGDLQDYAIYSPITPALRGTVPDPAGLGGGGFAEAFKALVDEADQLGPDSYWGRVRDEAVGLTDWLAQYEFPEPGDVSLHPGVPRGKVVVGFRDRHMAQGRDLLSSYDASEGALYVAFATVLAAYPATPLVFSVDNFDHSLNPRLARELVRCFCGWVIDYPGLGQRQAIITTHNPLILDGLDLTDDRIRLFAVERTSKGRTWAERVEVDEVLLRYAEEGWPLSRLWVMGEIGGVPAV